MVEVNIFINFYLCTYLDMTSILFLTCFVLKISVGNLFIFGIIFLYNNNLNAIIGMFEYKIFCNSNN